MIELRIFGMLAALVGLFGIYWASYVPIRRMESKVGSWENAQSVLASQPGHWALVVLVRVVAAALLVWLAAWAHRQRHWMGHAMLLIAVPLIWITDAALWLFTDL